MSTLDRYFALMKNSPELFKNSGDEGEIRIITNPDDIRSEEARLKQAFHLSGKPEHWTNIGLLAEDEWFWVVRDLVEFPGGKIGGYIRWINRKSQEGGFNVVLLCVQDEKVLIIKKYRHETRSWSWEFPRGFGEVGLTAEENATKELSEEIGILPASLELLTEVRNGKGGTAVFYVNLLPNQKKCLPN